MNNRVVVTGLGVISPVGQGNTWWTNLLQGVSGIKTITSFDVSNSPVQIAGEVQDFDPVAYVERKDARRMDRFCQMAVGAAKLALDDASLVVDQQNAERTGVIVGTGIGGIQTLEQQAKTLTERGVARISPFFVPMLIPDMASGQIAILTGAKGPNACTVTACASGTHCIGDAFRMIQRGDADVMLAGGAEAAVSPLGLAGFVAARALSTRNDEPQKASRPFDRDRDGFVMSEGAVVLVLETLERALARQCPIYGEIAGYASTADAHHITLPPPEGEGAQRAMKLALADAGMVPADIQYINAHGTSTQANDRCETKAIHAVFGQAVEQLAVSSTKSLTGHMLGAGGAFEAGVCLMALDQQRVPGTYNLDHPDDGMDLDYVPNQSRNVACAAAMSNSFGFGGHNSVLVFRRWQGA